MMQSENQRLKKVLLNGQKQISDAKNQKDVILPLIYPEGFRFK